jgi:outer membrane protein insertion porin family
MSYESYYISAGLSTGYSWYTLIGRFGIGTGLRAGFEFIKYDESVFRPFSSSLRDNLGQWAYNDRWYTKLSWDNRDIIFDPTNGFILSETFTIVGLLPAASSEYLKSVSRFDAYLTLFDLPVSETFSFKSVFKFHTALSYLAPKPGGEPIDVQKDGFYADGMFIARGWNPEADGQSLWDSSIELRFPIVKNILSFDLFLDMVGLWSSKDDFTSMEISDFKFSLGGGLRLANPQFPFSLYLVKKFEVDKDTGTINWNPESETATFKNSGLQLVISFGIDIYQ